MKDNARVKYSVLAEESVTIVVKGFSKPIGTYKIVSLFDALEDQGCIIPGEDDGPTLIVDQSILTK